MSRETQSYNITCPRCGRAGKLWVTENDHAFMRRNDRQVAASEGFSVKSSEALTATCVPCGVDAT